MLSDHVAPETKKKTMEAELKDYASKYSEIKIIGSGGNINRLYKLAHNKNDAKGLSVSDLKRMYDVEIPQHRGTYDFIRFEGRPRRCDYSCGGNISGGRGMSEMQKQSSFLTFHWQIVSSTDCTAS